MKKEESKLKEMLGEDWRNYRIYQGGVVYKSGFNPIQRIKAILYDLYHPTNYGKR